MPIDVVPIMAEREAARFGEQQSKQKQLEQQQAQRLEQEKAHARDLAERRKRAWERHEDLMEQQRQLDLRLEMDNLTEESQNKTPK